MRKVSQNVQGVPKTDEIVRQRLKAQEFPEIEFPEIEYRKLPNPQGECWRFYAKAPKKPQPVRADYNANVNKMSTTRGRKRKRLGKPTYKARRWPVPGEGTR